MGQEFVISNDHTLKHTLANIEKVYREKGFMKITYSTAKQRTLSQNAALHLWCRNVASELNEGGYDMRLVLKHHDSIPWTENAVKELIWRPTQSAILGKESTKQPKTDEYTQVYDVLNKFFGEKYGLHIEWPTQQSKVA